MVFFRECAWAGISLKEGVRDEIGTITSGVAAGAPLGSKKGFLGPAMLFL
jgi:hypothetical protein